MTREQAINYLICRGITEYRVSEIVRALTYEPTTKNDLGVDCISRKAAEDITWQDPSYTDPLNILTEVRDKIRELPSVTPQEPVIDKIRAEIEPTRKMYLDMNDIDWINGCDYVLSLIDKYKAESEG